jgi:hypothetical protein
MPKYTLVTGTSGKEYDKEEDALKAAQVVPVLLVEYEQASESLQATVASLTEQLAKLQTENDALRAIIEKRADIKQACAVKVAMSIADAVLPKEEKPVEEPVEEPIKEEPKEEEPPAEEPKEEEKPVEDPKELPTEEVVLKG